MPELPEVETVRAGIEQHVVGRTVAAAEVFNPRAVRRDLAGPGGFAAAMAGRTFLRAERRGKYLWFALDDTEALLAHLGMSGQFIVGDPDRPLSPHVRVRFTFTDGGPDLRFTDQRTFGHLMLCPLRGDDPPEDPPKHGGTLPPHSPPTGGRRQNRDAPRAVAEVKASWLPSAGGPQPGPPGAVAAVDALWVRLQSLLRPQRLGFAALWLGLGLSVLGWQTGGRDTGYRRDGRRAHAARSAR